ncbi:hypothetical protein [Pseudomonas petrae]|uniref:Uncharacterized protein n=1 Tax=Pseudomonas petrae TaxID=2912190 RepID=A0ABS9IB00_9PSED|nr:hypothetical protein [Pseudomonas petrae]MCF7535250.1 hypothetical protein [Pseudomonas petrae]MCF7540422.1 hypothetical protein [Pseudomonas petrae]MCF7544426.1 hypothetical protein [Pseudomonas petrae]MCF7558518.1 hypothetical protein [Pseudomonas petrae]
MNSHDPADTTPRAIYKFLFWVLLSVLLIYYLLEHVPGGIADADELVLKHQLKRGAWVYVTHYGAPATDLDTLRFYLSDPIPGADEEILKNLNERNSFVITDSALEDVMIRETEDGVGITVKGAVYRYFSKQYTQSDGLQSYRVSLYQQDERG